jgi:hypothetical protein
MTQKTWHATLTTLGWAEEVPAEILVDMRGPNGGKIGFGRASPAEVRRFAQELLDAANMVDPPIKLPEHNIYFRGYEIEPLIDPEENGGWTPCDWHKAACFRIYPPQPDRPVLDCAPETLNDARQEVLNDLASG